MSRLSGRVYPLIVFVWLVSGQSEARDVSSAIDAGAVDQYEQELWRISKVKNVLSKLDGSDETLSSSDLMGALRESEGWSPRTRLIIKRDRPLIGCLVELITADYAYQQAFNISRIGSIYQLIKNDCLAENVGSTLDKARAPEMEVLVRSLLRGHPNDPQTRPPSRALFDEAQRVYQNSVKQFHELEPSQSNKADLMWLIRFINYANYRILATKIFPLLAGEGMDMQDFEALRSIFAEEIREYARRS